MSEPQILVLLKKSKVPLNAKYLILQTGISRRNILRSLNRLRERGEIRFYISGKRHEYFYYLTEEQIKNRFRKNILGKEAKRE